jgi:hypothetical protein
MRAAFILLAALSAQADYTKGVCGIHTHEWMYRHYLGLDLSVFDGENQQQIKQYTQLNYGESVRLDSDKMPFGYDIDVRSDYKYDDSPKNLEVWVGNITNMDFSNFLDRNKSPYCSVGGWDWGNYWTWHNKIPVSLLLCGYKIRC